MMIKWRESPCFFFFSPSSSQKKRRLRRRRKAKRERETDRGREEERPLIDRSRWRMKKKKGKLKILRENKAAANSGELFFDDCWLVIDAVAHCVSGNSYIRTRIYLILQFQHPLITKQDCFCGSLIETKK